MNSISFATLASHSESTKKVFLQPDLFATSTSLKELEEFLKESYMLETNIQSLVKNDKKLLFYINNKKKDIFFRHNCRGISKTDF